MDTRKGEMNNKGFIVFIRKGLGKILTGHKKGKNSKKNTDWKQEGKEECQLDRKEERPEPSFYDRNQLC